MKNSDTKDTDCSESEGKQPITRHELRTFCEILKDMDNAYIPESKYCELKGIPEDYFSSLRKKGKFEYGYHPATRGCLKRLIHRDYDHKSGLIEIPGLDYTKPKSPLLLPKSVSDKKATKRTRGKSKKKGVVILGKSKKKGVVILPIQKTEINALFSEMQKRWNEMQKRWNIGSHLSQMQKEQVKSQTQKGV